MNTSSATEGEEPGGKLSELPAEWLLRWPFGPPFFANQLRGFVVDHCPDPSEGLPSVQIHLRDGTVLEVCHVIGFTPQWVALAVWEDDATMRTELLPYDAVLRVVIRARHATNQHIGFDTTREPQSLPDAETPEETLAAASGAPRDARDGKVNE